MSDIIDGFRWHSSTGISDKAVMCKQYVKKIASSDKRVASQFITAGKDLLIHKATKALWKFSDDGETIEPVFEEDVLTQEDLT